MIRYSSTNLHLTESRRMPSASLLSSASIADPWITVSLPASRLDVMVFEDGSVATRVTLHEDAHGAAHMSVEQARILRDSLTDALSGVALPVLERAS